MRVLVWQWGRYGAGPRICVDYVAGLACVPGTAALLSLSRQSEIMQSGSPPVCDLPVDTYRGVAGFVVKMVTAAALVRRLDAALRRLAPDAALCAMPGPLDLAMRAALRRAGIPMAVIVHDADAHPGDGYPLQMTLQRMLVRRADAVVTLSDHVTDRLRAQGLLRGKIVIRTLLPPPSFPGMQPVRAHGGPFRLLSFGRLLAYKGLDLLAGALAIVMPETDMVVRVVGEGPESAELDALRRLPRVTVENRWVPETELAALIGWADGLVVSHREASQSGVAAVALAARRLLVATRVGGLVEQVGDDPAAILCDISAVGVAEGIRAMLRAGPPAAAGPGQAIQAGLLSQALSGLVLEGSARQARDARAGRKMRPVGGAVPEPPNPPSRV